jgi:hypothetical protein
VRHPNERAIDSSDYTLVRDKALIPGLLLGVCRLPT